MASQYFIKFNQETGARETTRPYDKTVTEEQKNTYLSNGFELIDAETFQLLIGNVDGKEYVKNIEGSGYIVKPPYVPPLPEAKEEKIKELKRARDNAEVEPIESNGNLYDYDEKARDRINAAIIALELMGENATIMWTMADNTSAAVTAMELKSVIAAVAIRSNTLHVRYRRLKEMVMAAETVEEVNRINWDTVLEDLEPTEEE